MTIEVVLHRVLVEREIPEDTDAIKTKNAMQKAGFVVPESVRDELERKANREIASMDKGTVIALGETAFKDYGIDSPIKPGDFIIYAKFGGKDVTDPDDDKKYVIINDEDVVAIISKKEPTVG